MKNVRTMIENIEVNYNGTLGALKVEKNDIARNILVQKVKLKLKMMIKNLKQMVKSGIYWSTGCL